MPCSVQQRHAPADQQIQVSAGVPVLGRAAARAAGQGSLLAWEGLLDVSIEMMQARHRTDRNSG